MWLLSLWVKRLFHLIRINEQVNHHQNWMSNHRGGFFKHGPSPGSLESPTDWISVCLPTWPFSSAHLAAILDQCRGRSLTCLSSFNQGTEMCFYYSMECVGRLLVYNVNMKWDTKIVCDDAIMLPLCINSPPPPSYSARSFTIFSPWVCESFVNQATEVQTRCYLWNRSTTLSDSAVLWLLKGQSPS